ncbi:MAG: hypothetical protein M1836_007877 [Candelina mexicana]|nr:MAG: hypothetical protein M1836_007877 [Candelina mexicana]
MGRPALSECFSKLGFKAGQEKPFVNSLFKFILHPDHQDFMNEKVNVKSVNHKEMIAGYLDFHGDEFWSEEPSQRSHLTDDAVSYPDDAEKIAEWVGVVMSHKLSYYKQNPHLEPFHRSQYYQEYEVDGVRAFYPRITNRNPAHTNALSAEGNDDATTKAEASNTNTGLRTRATNSAHVESMASSVASERTEESTTSAARSTSPTSITNSTIVTPLPAHFATGADTMPAFVAAMQEAHQVEGATWTPSVPDPIFPTLSISQVHRTPRVLFKLSDKSHAKAVLLSTCMTLPRFFQSLTTALELQGKESQIQLVTAKVRWLACSYQLMNGDEQTFQRLIEEIKAW